MTTPDPHSIPSPRRRSPRWRRRFWWPSLIGGVVVLIVAAVLLRSRGDGSGDASPATTPTSAASTSAASTSPEPTDGTGGTGVIPSPSASPSAVPTGEPGDGGAQESEEFEQFVAACADSFEGWRPGQVAYPRTLDIDLDDSRTYTARIDIRPGAQQQPPPDPETATADLQVRCGIGARLVSIGSSVTVDDSEWFLLEFGEPGVVQWDWTVSATAPRDAEVRLELRPAVATLDGRYTVPAESNPNTATISFTTDVHVRSSAIQQVGTWFDQNWPVVTTVAVALGGAVLGLIAWVKKLRTAIRPESPAVRRRPRRKTAGRR